MFHCDRGLGFHLCFFTALCLKPFPGMMTALFWRSGDPSFSLGGYKAGFRSPCLTDVVFTLGMERGWDGQETRENTSPALSLSHTHTHTHTDTPLLLCLSLSLALSLSVFFFLSLSHTHRHTHISRSVCLSLCLSLSLSFISSLSLTHTTLSHIFHCLFIFPLSLLSQSLHYTRHYLSLPPFLSSSIHLSIYVFVCLCTIFIYLFVILVGIGPFLHISPFQFFPYMQWLVAQYLHNCC